MSLIEYGREHDEKRSAIQPLNDTYLSGQPYYCALCGLGYGEFLACEEPDCQLETDATAQARLAKAHTEGKGLPQP